MSTAPKDRVLDKRQTLCRSRISLAMLAGGPVSRKGLPEEKGKKKTKHVGICERGHTRSDEGETSLMSVEGFINGHDRQPEGGHEEIDEEKGGY